MQDRPFCLRALALATIVTVVSLLPLSGEAIAGDAHHGTSTTGTASLALSPILGVSRSSMSFGCIPFGDCERLDIVMSNDVSDPTSVLEITAITLTGVGYWMTAVNLPVILPGDGTIYRFFVSFCPEAAGMSFGSLIFESNGTNPSVEMRLLAHVGESTPPVSVPGGPYTGEQWEAIQLDGTASYDPDGDLISYRWWFDDGGPYAYGPRPTRSFASPGAYDCYLRVTDYCGMESYGGFQVRIGDNLDPICIVDETVTAGRRSTVVLDGSGSYDPDGVIVEGYWDFGDGRVADGHVAEHVYRESDTYVATFRIRDNYGTWSECRTMVEVDASPICDAGGPYRGAANVPLEFDGTGSYNFGIGPIVRHQWSFGDGTTGWGEITSHTYWPNGSYTATLTVRSNRGTSASCAVPVLIEGSNALPVCDAGEEIPVQQDSLVTFSGHGSYDPDGRIASYAWEFGDGGVAAGPLVEHIYTAASTFTVTLCVADSVGSRSCCAISIPVNIPPICVAGVQPAGLQGAPVSFWATSSGDLDGWVESFIWEFGDGHSASGHVAVHTYESGGEFTVTLTITDNTGGWAACNRSTSINALPVCDAGGPYNGTMGEPLEFDGSASYDQDGYIASYLWRFGDGAAAHGAIATHAYGPNMSFTATLIVTDDLGVESSCEVPVDITGDNAHPVCIIDAPSTGDIGLPVQLDGTGSYDPDGTILGFSWEFGDGVVAAGREATHFYGAIRPYTVTFCVTDDIGVRVCCNTEIDINNYAPICDLPASYHSNSGVDVLFGCDGCLDVDGEITEYAWDFGDGSTGSGPAMIHVYQDDGVYHATLCLTDDVGAQVCCDAVIDISNYPPICTLPDLFHSNPGVEILFACNECRDEDGDIVEYAWEFGDGSASTGEAIIHVYEDVGIYMVTLCLTDSGGDVTCCNMTADIDDANPVTLAYFNAAPQDGSVQIEWQSVLEQNLLGFNILRCDRRTRDLLIKINATLIAGRGSGGGTYFYIDHAVEPGREYGYWLETVDLDGSVTRHGPVWITISTSRPSHLVLEQNRPNPFNPRTTITFALPEASPVELLIYDAMGRPVRSFINGWRDAGAHSVEWDGLDDAGVASPSGAYFIRLRSGGETLTHKMVMIR